MAPEEEALYGPAPVPVRPGSSKSGVTPTEPQAVPAVAENNVGK